MALIIGDDGRLHAGPPGADPVRRENARIVDYLGAWLEEGQQVTEALDDQHQRLRARVDALAATVELLEQLLIGPAS